MTQKDSDRNMTRIAPAKAAYHSTATSGSNSREDWMRLGALLLLLGSLTLAGCSAKEAGEEEAPTVTVQVGAAEKQDIQRKVTADAILYPLDQAALVPKITSPVKKFYVERGSRVHAGEVLAELEAQDLDASVNENQGGLEQAQASYEAAVQKAQQDRAITKQELEDAQKLYDARQNLFKQGAVSARDVADASIALTQAKAADETAQKELDLKVAQGQLTAAKGKSAGAQAQLSYTKIVSPIDGVVTDRPVYPGEMPATGTPHRNGYESVASRCARAYFAARGGRDEGWRPCHDLGAGAEPGREGQGYAGESRAGPEQHDG